MKLFPAIDLKDKQVVRLLRGDYNQLTVYHHDPLTVAKEFEAQGAEFLHMVDLDGAKDGSNANFEVVQRVCQNTSLKVEIGGGIRDEAVILRYLEAGVFRVILGTVAIKDPDFTAAMIRKYGEKIAVGVDILDGMVAIRGWTEISTVTCDEIFARLEKDGVKTVICTDISKDGAMIGTNRALYASLSARYRMDIVASGGISDMEDLCALADMKLYGAILGKALYTGAIDLKQALEVIR